jgi:ArsR family transcriptional regulator, nickel/cobalt-responsive transcriptional repressor
MSCVDIMKILSDETRFAVLQRLLDGPLHVHEINAELLMDPTLLSHHLKVLRDAELVSTKRDGKQILYALAPSVRRGRDRRTLDFGCCKLQFAAN